MVELRLDQDKVGQRSPVRTHTLERGAVVKFARALGSQDPIHLESVAAQAAGYRDVVAMPTFAVTLLPWDIPGLELPGAGVLHGEQEFEWGAPLVAGDQIRVTGWAENVKTRGGQQGTMTIITIASEGWNQDNELAFRARAVLIVTEGAAREGGR